MEDDNKPLKRSSEKPLSIPGRRKVITKNMIIDSQKNTLSGMEAARWLDVQYNTYKKWAKRYGLFDQHSVVKQQLIEKGYWTDECTVCGYNEVNMKTEKVCLGIDFIDGEHQNFLLENIRLLCANCYLSFNGMFEKSKRFCK